MDPGSPTFAGAGKSGVTVAGHAVQSQRRRCVNPAGSGAGATRRGAAYPQAYVAAKRPARRPNTLPDMRPEPPG